LEACVEGEFHVPCPNATDFDNCYPKENVLTLLACILEQTIGRFCHVGWVYLDYGCIIWISLGDPSGTADPDPQDQERLRALADRVRELLSEEDDSDRREIKSETLSDSENTVIFRCTADDDKFLDDAVERIGGEYAKIIGRRANVSKG
jgi:hypothetical protein